MGSLLGSATRQPNEHKGGLPTKDFFPRTIYCLNDHSICMNMNKYVNYEPRYVGLKYPTISKYYLDLKNTLQCC
jgi:hypothetical protein